MKFRPLHDRVLVQRIDEDEKTLALWVMTQNQNFKNKSNIMMNKEFYLNWKYFINSI